MHALTGLVGKQIGSLLFRLSSHSGGIILDHLFQQFDTRKNHPPQMMAIGSQHIYGYGRATINDTDRIMDMVMCTN